MPFVKGQSGNMNGRPTKERMEEKPVVPAVVFKLHTSKTGTEK